jgi:hypothetical protein
MPWALVSAWLIDESSSSESYDLAELVFVAASRAADARDGDGEGDGQRRETGRLGGGDETEERAGVRGVSRRGIGHSSAKRSTVWSVSRPLFVRQHSLAWSYPSGISE